MPLTIETRPSDSPYIERVWRSRSEGIQTFTSIAVTQSDFVVWTENGVLKANVHGPETQASSAPVPDNTDFCGIHFRTGVYLAHLPPFSLVNGSLPLAEASRRAFWLQGSTWEFPTFENAEVFVARLVQRGLLSFDPVVAAVLRGETPDYSLREVQRRFKHTTGLSFRDIQKIERARQAALMLRDGLPILDVTQALGYFDQSHLTHALRHFIGHTPARLLAGDETLSLLYKTSTPE